MVLPKETKKTGKRSMRKQRKGWNLCLRKLWKMYCVLPLRKEKAYGSKKQLTGGSRYEFFTVSADGRPEIAFAGKSNVEIHAYQRHAGAAGFGAHKYPAGKTGYYQFYDVKV